MRGLRLGRVFGIDLQIAPSWIVIFGLATLNLVVALAAVHPQWSATLRLVLALGAALLFFSSVLVHELAHALVARRQGIPVLNITLLLFGGVANMEHEPSSPR